MIPDTDMATPEREPLPPPKSEVDAWIRTRLDVQKTRMAVSNRLGAAERGGWTAPMLAPMQEQIDVLLVQEASLERRIRRVIRKHPAWPWCKSVRGIGETNIAPLLEYLDPTKPHVSSWYRYCGLAVDNTTHMAVKRTKGEKANWNPYLKVCCYLIGESFVKAGGTYRAVYDEAKAFYQGKYPEWSKLHAHRAAMRKATKLFLSHLHAEWRKALGLETDPPYPQQILGHGGYIAPESQAEKESMKK